MSLTAAPRLQHLGIAFPGASVTFLGKARALNTFGDRQPYGEMAEADMTELKRILHADDDPDIREIVGMALEFFGDFQLKQCVDGPSACEACVGFKPQLLLLDYMMPGMTGPEAWQIIRRIDGLEKIPAIFLTAKAEASVSDHLLSNGAANVILKPFDPETLVGEITKTWQRVHVAP